MKWFEIPKFGIDNLQVREGPVPTAAKGEVLVRMRAASLNYRDYLVVEGKYNPRLRMPMIPLSDGVGVVEEVGQGVKAFAKGDRVAGCFMQNWVEGDPDDAKGASALGGSLDGILREYVVFPEHGLVHVPAHLSDEEAASLPCAAVTAWNALFERAPAIPGDTVLIQGTGGVSIFALQFALAGGLRTVVTSSSDEKLARAKQLGAHEVINYRSTPDWGKAARRLTGGTGVDRVIDVGGSQTLPEAFKSTRTGGTICSIGILTGADPSLSPIPILMGSLNVRGIYVGSRKMFENMNRLIELKLIRPVIDTVYPWSDYGQALRYMEGQSHFGKICLRF